MRLASADSRALSPKNWLGRPVRIAPLVRLLLLAFAAVIVAQSVLGMSEVKADQLALILGSLALSVVQTSASFSNAAAHAVTIVFVVIVFVSYQLPAWNLASDSRNFYKTFSVYPEPEVWVKAMTFVVLAQVVAILVGMTCGAGFTRKSEDPVKTFTPPELGTARAQIIVMTLLLLPIWAVSLASGFARGATSSGPMAYLVLFISPLVLAGVASSVVVRGRKSAQGLWGLALAVLVAVPLWEILNGKRGGLTIAMFAFFLVWMLMRGPRARVSGRSLVAGAVVLILVLPLTTWIAQNFREGPDASAQRAFSLSDSLSFVGDRAGAFESTVAVMTFEETLGRAGNSNPTPASVLSGVLQYTFPSALDVVSDSASKDGLGVRFSAQYLGIPSGNAGAWGGIGISYSMLGPWGMLLPGLAMGLCVVILRRLQSASVVGIGLAVATVYALVWGFMASGNIDAILAGWVRTSVFYVVLAGALEAWRRQRAPEPSGTLEAPTREDKSNYA